MYKLLKIVVLNGAGVATVEKPGAAKKRRHRAAERVRRQYGKGSATLVFFCCVLLTGRILSSPRLHPGQARRYPAVQPPPEILTKREELVIINIHVKQWRIRNNAIQIRILTKHFASLYPDPNTTVPRLQTTNENF